VRSDDSLATVLLAGRPAGGGGVQPLKASEFWPLRDRVSRPGVLLGRTEEGLVAEHGLEPDLARRVVGLLGRATALAFELERLDQSGISTLTPYDDGYPPRLVERLGAKAPPVLHAAGALDLLLRPGVGVVGRDDVSVEGAEVAREAGGMAARLGLPVVSGGDAPGVGQAATDGARHAGGSVVGILAGSLARTLRRPDVRRAVYAGSTVLCTPFGPDTPFSAGNARGRNLLVHALSLVTLLVECDVETAAIAEGVGRVAVWRAAAAVAVNSIDDLEALLRDSGP
jgi:predicted Rossmann fold nucleotide-binding protein DprA/Smf involved in DNA uptake